MLIDRSSLTAIKSVEYIINSTKQREIFTMPSNEDTLNHFQIDRNFMAPSKENVTSAIDSDRRITLCTSGDKLHRRNPATVRQEIQFYDDLIPENNLGELQLTEMPGLHNTEQWKRIACRIGQASPPLSRQYCQGATCLFEPVDGYLPDLLGSYPRPTRSENEEEISSTTEPLFRSSRCKIILGLLFGITVIAILISVVIAVIFVRKSKSTATDHYPGTIVVRTRFNPVLLSISSTLATNYQREFCSLISNTLADMKTKYAIFYSTCRMDQFRNGSILGDFTLGFTRYQNVTRLNAFLTRTIVNKQLFGGTIVSIIFNSTENNPVNDTDYDVDYKGNESINLWNVKQNSNPLDYISDERDIAIEKDTSST